MDEKTFLNVKWWSFLFLHPKHYHLKNTWQKPNDLYFYILLTPWCRVLLEKLTGLQLVKKFPAFYGTRRFITAHLHPTSKLTRTSIHIKDWNLLSYWTAQVTLHLVTVAVNLFLWYRIRTSESASCDRHWRGYFISDALHLETWNFPVALPDPPLTFATQLSFLHTQTQCN